jgi:hypothetical protein
VDTRKTAAFGMARWSREMRPSLRCC